MKTSKQVLALCLVGCMAGCSNMSSTEERTLSGAGIGAAAGALIGGLATGRPLRSAAIGLWAGAPAGCLSAHHSKTVGRRPLDELDVSDPQPRNGVLNARTHTPDRHGPQCVA